MVHPRQQRGNWIVNNGRDPWLDTATEMRSAAVRLVMWRELGKMPGIDWAAWLHIAVACSDAYHRRGLFSP